MTAAGHAVFFNAQVVDGGSAHYTAFRGLSAQAIQASSHDMAEEEIGMMCSDFRIFVGCPRFFEFFACANMATRTSRKTTPCFGELPDKITCYIARP